MSSKCESCGKFRKDEDCVILEYSCWDGMEVEQELTCRWCMSLIDAKRYFPEIYKEKSEL